jgi:protein arginine kinase activator
MNHTLLCELCGKKAEFAVIRRSGKVPPTERNLCHACAADFERISCARVGPALSDLLLGLVMDNSITSPETNRTKVCPNCGNNEKEIVGRGSVGCPECYDVFRNQIEAVIREMHGWSPRE